MSLNGGIVAYGELPRMCKEAIIVCFKVVSQCMPGGSKENHDKDQDCRPPCQWWPKSPFI